MFTSAKIRVLPCGPRVELPVSMVYTLRGEIDQVPVGYEYKDLCIKTTQYLYRLLYDLQIQVQVIDRHQ